VLRVGRHEEWGGSDGWGPLGSDVGGNAVDGLRILEEEAPFGKFAKATQAEWAERAHGGLRAKRPGCSGLGRMALEISTRRFRMNFDMRIFPKFF
jgi:hypothetical protein